MTVIAPKVAGFISAVAIEDNQSVRAGDLLIRIDDRDFRAALDSAGAMVAAQKASLANLDATRKLQEALVDQAAADISAAEAEVARTRFDYDRYDRLSAAQFASKQRFQQADADHKKALAAGSRARAALNAARRQIAVIETQKAQAGAALDQALAQQKIAALNLSYTEIRAPIDGIVGNRAARAGAYAPVGAALISLVPASGLWVDANFKESQLAHMRGGQRATIIADVAPGEIAAATIGAIASLAPTLGPTVGGWITDSFSWRWLFFVNLPPGLFIAVVVPLMLRIDKPNVSLIRSADYLGIVLMALFLGCLEYTLEEGPRWGW
ncbi:membrane fusion protein, multidrug efflux system [Rhodoblastus acidophilus]|uniref:Membrane fusion protein, multidrug efflux system n=1 Tax=Rhodoblastus acidophilus TaxID=1074 RepID=A0A212S8X9_RHOAC|nr:HlyD family secretion protein [Rhodoblastus acidophilus]SNB81630.1 membrane fusion protein, multidrug efflux system [Rhodoblastus acidophilus]